MSAEDLAKRHYEDWRVRRKFLNWLPWSDQPQEWRRRYVQNRLDEIAKNEVGSRQEFELYMEQYPAHSDRNEVWKEDHWETWRAARASLALKDL